MNSRPISSNSYFLKPAVTYLIPTAVILWYILSSPGPRLNLKLPYSITTDPPQITPKAVGWLEISCNFSFSTNWPSIRWAFAPVLKKVRQSLFPILKFCKFGALRVYVLIWGRYLYSYLGVKCRCWRKDSCSMRRIHKNFPVLHSYSIFEQKIHRKLNLWIHNCGSKFSNIVIQLLL